MNAIVIQNAKIELDPKHPLWLNAPAKIVNCQFSYRKDQVS